jgi:hypothetical protein
MQVRRPHRFKPTDMAYPGCTLHSMLKKFDCAMHAQLLCVTCLRLRKPGMPLRTLEHSAVQCSSDAVPIQMQCNVPTVI